MRTNKGCAPPLYGDYHSGKINMQAFSFNIFTLLALQKRVRKRKNLQIPCKFEG